MLDMDFHTFVVYGSKTARTDTAHKGCDSVGSAAHPGSLLTGYQSPRDIDVAQFHGVVDKPLLM